MKTCICTVIKDEQDYIDEWIRYHIKIGIDRIFIFEDIDSGSHLEITKKYDQVVLLSVYHILSEPEKKEANKVKITHQYNLQHLYYRNILKWISNMHKYDWCFVIDTDEFIVLPEKSLHKTLNEYHKYDAIVMSWKCFGANGLANKPVYTDTVGVVETFKKECEGKISDLPEALIKTCYNIKRYKEEFFHNQHHPSEICNWVNTGFQKSYTPNYSKLYLNHYITKSFEEYANKLANRGFLWGGMRDLDLFFEINPDLKPKREELMDSREETLVVLPYIHYYAQGNELILALSAWKKFCQFKYHFVVIGTCPETIQKEFPWVEFIYCPQIPDRKGQYLPHLDVQHKMEVVYNKYKDKYKGFIRMMDDIYAIKPFNLKDITTVHYDKKDFIGDENAPDCFWTHDKWKTRQLLDRENLKHIDYATHFPSYFAFDELCVIWDKFNMREESYSYEDIYFNFFPPKIAVLDDYIRTRIISKEAIDTIFETAIKTPYIKFISNSMEGHSKEFEYLLSKIVFES